MKQLITILNEIQNDYKIYCDLDGVLTNFDHQLKNIGIDDGRAFEKKHGPEAFWEKIDAEGEDFWSKMPWQPGGKQLWDYIKDKNTEILSAPAKTIPESKTGKVKWVKKNLGSVKLNLKQAATKKDFAGPKSILIDDYEKNIKQWKAAGGIGILHTDVGNTLKQLKKLGI